MYPKLSDVFVVSIMVILWQQIVPYHASDPLTNEDSLKTETSQGPSETIKTVKPIETVKQLKKKIADENKLQLKVYKHYLKKVPKKNQAFVKLLMLRHAEEIARKDHELQQKEQKFEQKEQKFYQETKLLNGNLTAEKKEKKSYEKVLRIISARSKLEGLVDKLYPLREDTKTHEMIYGRPRMGYCEALNEMLTSEDKRFTQDPFVCMVRQRLIDRNIEVKVFMKFARWLYSQFSDKTCHKMAQFAPQLPDYNNTEEIKEMFKVVEIDQDIPAVVCMQIMLQPLDMPPSNTTVALPSDTTVALPSDTKEAPPSNTAVAPPSGSKPFDRKDI